MTTIEELRAEQAALRNLGRLYHELDFGDRHEPTKALTVARSDDPTLVELEAPKQSPIKRWSGRAFRPAESRREYYESRRDAGIREYTALGRF